MSDSIFTKVEEDFKLCLSSEEKDVGEAMEKLKASLREAEFLSEHAKNYSGLFLEMFQFQATSSKSFWAEMPKLFSAIGEFIHLKNSHEEEFREEVAHKGLGRGLDIVL